MIGTLASVQSVVEEDGRVVPGLSVLLKDMGAWHVLETLRRKRAAMSIIVRV